MSDHEKAIATVKGGGEWRAEATTGYRFSEAIEVFGFKVTVRATPSMRWRKGFHVWANEGQTATDLLGPLREMFGCFEVSGR